MASSAAQLQAAFKVTAWDGNLMVFETGDKVFLRSSVVGIGAVNGDFDYTPYTVLEWKTKTDGAGNLLDKAGITAVGSTVANIATDGTTPDTAAEWPVFYLLRNDATSDTSTVHESDLIDVTGVNTLIALETWT